MPKGSSSSVRIFYPKYDRDSLIQELLQKLNLLLKDLPLVRVILFGSYAKGNYTVASDIDLLIVYRGRERKDAYTLVRKTFAISGLELHIYAEEEYDAMKDIVYQMTRGGIVLFPDHGS